MAQKDVFSEAEVAEIVKRAAAIQEDQAKAGVDYQPGISRAELMRIAREIGLSEDVLNKALDEVSAQKGQKKSGSAFSHEFERVIEGEISPDDFDILIDLLSKPTNNTSSPTQVGRTLSSKTMVGMLSSELNVTSRKGRTRLNLKTNSLLPAILGAQIALVGMGIGAGIIGDGGMIGVGIATMLSALVGGWGLFNWGSKSGVRKAEKLMDDLEGRIRAELDSKDADQIDRQRLAQESPAAARHDDEELVSESYEK